MAGDIVKSGVAVCEREKERFVANGFADFEYPRLVAQEAKRPVETDLST